jgi:hypothetical protein
MQQRLARNPHLSHAIAASRVEEPVVLQKPTTAAVLNKTLVDVLARGTRTASAFAPNPPPVMEGSEDRVG